MVKNAHHNVPVLNCVFCMIHPVKTAFEKLESAHVQHYCLINDWNDYKQLSKLLLIVFLSINKSVKHLIKEWVKTSWQFSVLGATDTQFTLYWSSIPEPFVEMCSWRNSLTVLTFWEIPLFIFLSGVRRGWFCSCVCVVNMKLNPGATYFSINTANMNLPPPLELTD